jgi:hypothetical protein
MTKSWKGENNPKYKHGLRHHPLYGVHKMMMRRCYNQKQTGYEFYGGRGIKVYEPWHDVKVFIEYMESMGMGNPDGKTLDRIDSNGHYWPGNLRLATQEEQHNNQTNNIKIEYEGQQYNVTELAIKLNMPRLLLYHRIKVAGWSIEETINTPWKTARNRLSQRMVHYKNEDLTLEEGSKKYGIPLQALIVRYQRGWAIERMFEQPCGKRIRSTKESYRERKI